MLNLPPADIARSCCIWTGMNGKQRAIKHCVCMVLAMCSINILMVLTGLSHSPNPTGLFENSQYNMSKTFPTDVSMDKWSGFIDVLIPMINSYCLLFSLLLTCKRNDYGPVCCNPEVHPPRFYLIWPIICVTDIGDLFLSDRCGILQAFWLKLLSPLLTFYMLFYSYINVQHHRTLLHVTCSQSTRFLYYLAQNGLAVSAWWNLLDALVNLGIVLKYVAGLQDPVVSSLILTLLFLAMLLWFILENFIWVQYIHYNFTVYPILILGLSSMFTRGYQAATMAPNTVYCGFLMLVATVMNCVFLFRLCCDSNHSIPVHTLPSPRPGECPSVCLALDKHASEGKWNLHNNYSA
ncbi:hypothetical protein ACEWY4_018925 [Coilia grayii]|uniref:Uncharacterized protein n=1 Tax=Coilia grayii TaxID=363190 RepID=A0ABD1JGV9_9TELE